MTGSSGRASPSDDDKPTLAAAEVRHPEVTAVTDDVNSATRSRPQHVAGPPRRGLWVELRPLVLRLHFSAGVLAGPFILLAACTGLLSTAAPQVEGVVHRHELTVPVGGDQLPLSRQVTAARQAHPGGDLTSVTPPVADDSSTRVVFTDLDVPADYARTVFVDPYTGEVLGQVTSFGQWLVVRAWLDELHRNLHLGAVGRAYSEVAAS